MATNKNKLCTNNSTWVRCPYCNAKTRTKIYTESVLLAFPLYCSLCKKEYRVDIIQQKIYPTTIKPK